MDHLTLLAYSGDLLRQVVGNLADEELGRGTNCPPWTVRHLASHALKNQLFWAGTVTGQDLMPLDEAMAAVPYDGALGPIADDVTARAGRLWSDEGVLDSEHSTPFGVLPGAVVIDFAIVDAAAHAWDLSSSLGRAVEFADDAMPAMTGVFASTCTAHTVKIGLIKPPAHVPSDATPTEWLLAAAGRAVPR